MRAVEWDGPSYDLNSGFQLREGRKFVEAIELRGDEIAIDAGCGPGRVTRLLAERLPGGRVTGVDASEAMIETARANLADLHPRVELVVSDLLRFEPAEPLDLVFSTHALHWIGDHDLLFARIYDWLLPGGRLAAVLGAETTSARCFRRSSRRRGGSRTPRTSAASSIRGSIRRSTTRSTASSASGSPT